MPHVAAFAGLAIALAASATLWAASRNGDPSWPDPGIRVSPVLQPCTDIMVQRSRTFGSLYRALDRRTDLRVAVDIGSRDGGEPGNRRAETTIHRIGPLREAR